MVRHLYLLVSIGVFVLDRFTKTLVENHLPLHQSETIIPDYFDFTHTRNTGVAFGFLANSQSTWIPYFLTFISAIALVIILFFSLRQSVGNWKLKWGLMLVLGGAAGNLYDRVQYGYVIDFIDVFYKSYHWPTFNVADASISFGIGMLMLEILTQKPRFEEGKTLPVEEK
jgi:signal peptidase II